MDDLQEAEALEAALDALGDSPTTAQILDVLKGGYRDAGVAAALKRTGGGGGGAPTITRAIYGGDNATVISAGGQGLLEVGAKLSGDALLNITDPTDAKVVDAGVYAVSAVVDCWSGLDVDGSYTVSLNLDNDGDNASFQTNSASSVTGFTGPRCGVSGVYYIPEGSGLEVRISNHQGGADKEFAFASLIVQRLS